MVIASLRSYVVPQFAACALGVCIGLMAPSPSLAAQSTPASTQILRFPAPEPPEPRALRLGLMFSGDSKTLVAFDGDGSAYGAWATWDILTGKPVQPHGDSWLPIELRRIADRVQLLERGQNSTAQKLGSMKSVAPFAPRPTDVLFPLAAVAKDGGSPARYLNLTMARIERLAACLSISGTATPSAGSVVSGVSTTDLPAFVGEVLIFDPSTGTVVRSLASPGVAGADSRQTRIADLAFSPDGRRIAAVVGDGSMLVWTCTDGKLVASTRADPTHAMYEPLRFYVEGDSPAREGLHKLMWIGNDRLLTTLVAKPDAREAGYRKLRIWTPGSNVPEPLEWTESPTKSVDGSPDAPPPPVTEPMIPKFLVCSPDGKRALLVISSKDTGKYRTEKLEVVDLAARAVLGAIQVPASNALNSMAFAPDSSTVALGIRSGAILVTATARLERMAREYKSMADLSTVDAAKSSEPSPQKPGKKSPPKADKTPPGVQTIGDSTEFRLPRTGLYLKSRLAVVFPYWPPETTHDAPTRALLGGLATLQCRVTQRNSEHDFEDARAALHKQLIDDVRSADDECIQEKGSAPGLEIYVFGKPPRAKDPLQAQRWHEAPVMQALIADPSRIIQVDITYPYNNAAQLYAPLRELLLAPRLDPQFVFDPFENLGWSGKVPEGLRAVPHTELMLTPSGDVGKHGRQWDPRDTDPEPVVWITTRFAPDDFSLENQKVDETQWYAAATRALGGIKGAVVRSSASFTGAGTTGWELIIERPDTKVTWYQAVFGGKIEPGDAFFKIHRAKVRVMGMVATADSDAWIPKFRALALGLVRKEY